MSRAESTFAQFPYTSKNQHLHIQTSAHHQYTQQQSQFVTPQDNNIIAQTPSGTPNPQYTTTSIAPPTLGTQTRRYKAPQHTSIAPPTPNTPNRQYSSSNQHPLIAAQLKIERPSSPLISAQCLPTTNNVPTLSSSISPASLPTPPIVPTGLSSPNGTTAATNFDLQDIIVQFGAQPELLKLILTSKVEEDKRKAEEAKLRVRELDLMLMDRDRHRKCLVDESRNDEIHSNQDIDYENDNSITFSTSDGSLNYASFGTSLSSPAQNLSLNSPSSNPSRLNKSTPKSQSTPQDQLTSQNNQMTSQYSHNQADQEAAIESTENEESNVNGPPNKRKRKRREMLPVTMIIETKENPFKDEYLWKNNGNTTQRKTGNKSVYFKCSNSNKGCPVNKTVTERECGWIIKYRGHHLEVCGKIKRIVQS